MFQFEKPGRRDDFDYPQMVKESVTKALADATIKYNDLNQAVVGYVYGMYYFLLIIFDLTETIIFDGKQENQHVDSALCMK